VEEETRHPQLVGDYIERLSVIEARKKSVTCSERRFDRS
jgi:hypothetical protein